MAYAVVGTYGGFTVIFTPVTTQQALRDQPPRHLVKMICA
jgi:hypothetical protein